MSVNPMAGGQFQGALKAIIETERQPIKQLEARKAREETKAKLFQEFKSKFSAFDNTLAEISNFNKLKEYKVELGDGANLVSVSFEKEKVQTGSYQLEVVSLAKRSSLISNGYESATEPVLGLGYVVFYNGNGDKEEIFIPENASSLQGVADRINNRANSTVQATVVKDGTDADRPYRLILNAKNDGLDDEVIFPEFYFLDGDEDLSVERRENAENAVVKLNGFEIETEGNIVPNFLGGLTLNLKQAKEGQPFTMTIAEDIPKVAAKFKGFIDQINGVLEFINKQNTVDDKTDTSTTFAGDTSLQTIEYRLRNLVHEGFPSYTGVPEGDEPNVVNLSEMGIEIGKNGLLTVKEDKLNKAMETNFARMTDAISGPDGFASQLRAVVANYTRPGSGLLAIREQGLKQRISKIDRDIESKQKLLDRKTEALTNQFARLSGTMANLQRQQSYLAATMGSSGGDPIAQLIGG